MILSIIIPIYNGAADISRCLDSIYSQGLDDKQFEVICIDDCSPDPSSVAAIENYKFQGGHPSNLILVKHEVNKRQGGARNTGIRIAKGEWILFIDHDDFFISQSVVTIMNAAKDNEQLDFIMFDYVTGNGTSEMGSSNYFGLNERIMSGSEFLQVQPVPWCPWCYLYHREFLHNSGCLFAENVIFEDTDFVLKITSKAKKARFLPVKLVYHTVHPAQTTHIGNNKKRIEDYYKMSYRAALTAKEVMSYDEKAGKAIANHICYICRTGMMRFLWRLPYNDIRTILQNYRYPLQTGDFFVDFTNRHTEITAFILSLLAPFLRIAAALKHLAKR